MKRSRFAFVWIALCAAFVLLTGRPAKAGLTIVSQDVRVDTRDQQVFFNLVFNHPPDLQTTDSFGRRAESFQYEIDPNAHIDINSAALSEVSAVVRGDEIGSGYLLPVRNGFGAGVDPSPAAGGWGPVRGRVPFRLQSDQFSFAVPFAMLGTYDGNFAYRVFTTDYGATDSLIVGTTVPLPPALPIGLLTLLAIGGGIAWKRRRQRSV